MIKAQRLQVAVVVGLMLAAACGGGGDEPEETTDTVALEDIEPIVEIDPCDLIDSSVAEELSGAEVGDAQLVEDDDGGSRCDFAFADDSVAEDTGSAIAASLAFGSGDADDVPGGALARSLSIGEASAVEEVEDEAKVRVVYVVQRVVVRVEVVSGDGELSPELVEEIIEFAETTEGPVTEAVTGEDFVPEPDEPTTSTTEPDDEAPEPGDELDEVIETLTVDRAGGLDEFTFEADANSIAFIRFPVVTPADPAGPCLRVSITDADDVGVTSSGCLLLDGTGFIDRTILERGGTYKVTLDPDAIATGTVQVRITGATDSEGTIGIDGPTVTAAITQPGAVHRLTFEAGARAAIFVSFPRVTPTDPEGGCLRASITTEDEVGITSSGCLDVAGTSFIDRTELPDAGTYVLTLDPDGTQTGSIDVQITAAT